MADYQIPCGKTGVHPSGVCRQRLHPNVTSGLSKLIQRLDQEAMEAELENQRVQMEEAKKRLDLEYKMAQVGAGTHRVIKERRQRGKKR